MSPQAKFLIALFFAIAVETGVLFLLMTRVFKVSGQRNSDVIYAGVMATASSLPYLWFVLPAFVRNYTVYTLIGEGAVAAWEALFYQMFFRIGFKRAAVLSITANAASWILGYPFLWLFDF
jgi:hypothetical protein